ncbi:hypothetical protein DPMN_090296 [Dreissena polymorpha]|uniref:Macro domain-containing protein n=2 Tax=Dreissena polymorpha TaxID=45954 RepID=A0A9D4KXZ7_DREPO|nr:hypothetical protein DPMN_090296 [Dreissena polymorpha]
MGNSNKKMKSSSKKTVSNSNNMTIQEIKEKYLNMPLDEKRTKYKCKKYVTVNEIKPWQEHGLAVIEKYPAKDVAPKYEVDDELNKKISLWTGDITTLEIDAIINAANKSLLGGGGVDGCIHRMAGSYLYDECVTLNGCSTEDAKLSGGYRLPAKYVIHTVGPIGEQEAKLSSCYNRCLDIAMETDNIKTIAFPCISTGIYGYDIEKATPVVMRTVREWLKKPENSEKIERIIFCVFLKGDVAVYEENLLQYFPVETVEENKIRETNTQTKKKNKTKTKTPQQGNNTTSNGNTGFKRNPGTDDEEDKELSSNTDDSKINKVEAQKENESKQTGMQGRTHDTAKTGTDEKRNQSEQLKTLSAPNNKNTANEKSITANSPSKQHETEDYQKKEHENKHHDESTLASQDADHNKQTEIAEINEGDNADKSGDVPPEKK